MSPCIKYNSTRSSLILVMSYPICVISKKKLSKNGKSSEFHNFASTGSCVASRVSIFVNGRSSLRKSCFRNRPGQWRAPYVTPKSTRELVRQVEWFLLLSLTLDTALQSLMKVPVPGNGRNHPTCLTSSLVLFGMM